MAFAWSISVILIFVLVTHYRDNSESLVRDRADSRNALIADFVSEWAKGEASLQQRLAELQFSDAEFALLDRTGVPIAATTRNSAEFVAPDVVKGALGSKRVAASGVADGTFYSLEPVPGTPWTMALTIPESTLYATLPPAWLQWVLISLFAGILLLVVLLFERVLSSRRKLKVVANLDSLTRLPNRGFTTTLLSQELAERAPMEALSVLLIDVDFFKQINDQFGHAAGDEVLGTLASRMQNALRPDDIIGRWGGEEFLAILKHTRIQTAEEVAERLRETIEADPIFFKNMTLSVSISIGCVQARADTLDQIVDRADLAMYEAKRSGRNVVVAA